MGACPCRHSVPSILSSSLNFHDQRIRSFDQVMGWVMASSLAPIGVTDGAAPISAAQSGGADWIVLLEDGADEER